MEDLRGRLTFAVTLMVSSTLCFCVFGMVTAYFLGLW